MPTYSTVNAVPTMTSNILPSGLVTYSSQQGINTAWRVFDRNTSTFWETSQQQTCWIAYEFTIQKIIYSYTITSASSAYNPRSFTFEGSNDGINWTILDTRINQSWVENSKKTFTIQNTNPYKTYKINVSQTGNSGATYACQITEIEMFEIFFQNKILLSSGDKGFTLSRKYTDSLIPTMTSNAAPNGIASASDETLTPAFRAFDGVATSNRYWAANAKTYGWVAYDFNTPTIVARYGLTVILSNPTFAPKDWTFEGSIDGVNWTVLDRQTNQTTWINDTPNIYNMKKIGVYQKYRLNITSNNGATTVGIGEMMMYGIKHLSMRSFQNISEKIYVNYGMDEVENLTINIGEIKEHTNTNVALGSGKTFEHTIDMSKRRIDKIKLG